MESAEVQYRFRTIEATFDRRVDSLSNDAVLIRITAVSKYKGRQGRWLEFARFVVVAPVRQVRQVMYSLFLRGLADRVFVLFVLRTSSDVACRLRYRVQALYSSAVGCYGFVFVATMFTESQSADISVVGIVIGR